MPVEVDGVIELGLAGWSRARVCRAGDVAGRDEISQGLARAVADRTGVDNGARGVVDEPAAPGFGIGEDLPRDGGRDPAVSGYVARLIGEVQCRGRVDDDGRLLAGAAAGRASRGEIPGVVRVSGKVASVVGVIGVDNLGKVASTVCRLTVDIRGKVARVTGHATVGDAGKVARVVKCLAVDSRGLRTGVAHHLPVQAGHRSSHRVEAARIQGVRRIGIRGAHSCSARVSECGEMPHRLRDCFVGSGDRQTCLAVLERPHGHLALLGPLAGAPGHACGIALGQRLAQPVREPAWMVGVCVRDHVVEDLLA